MPMLREGLMNVKQILRDISRNPRLKFETFRIKQEIYW